jgi:hypothetical protein
MAMFLSRRDQTGGGIGQEVFKVKRPVDLYDMEFK